MKVIIIGCGISGPVLAMLLQHKGFEVEIFERAWAVGTGVSLVIAPQTFKVLNILGLADDLLKISGPIDEFLYTSQITGTALMHTDFPAEVRQSTGWPVAGVPRRVYREFLLAAATARGVPIHFEKKASNVKQEGDRVVVEFEDGTTAEADLVVGCDGLHSAVRDAIFGKQKADYCGVIQVGGISNIQSSWDGLGFFNAHTMFQVFGDGGHFVSYPVNDKQRSFFCTLPSKEESKESWQGFSVDQLQEELHNLPQLHWQGGPKEIIENTTGLVKYGLYDRPELEMWYKGRIVLCGDAAHATTPHLGQGANQAIEDCYQLVRLLVQHGGPLNSTYLEPALEEYEALRKPRSSVLVKYARREGDMRVVQGKRECRERDVLVGQGTSREGMKLLIEAMNGPFQGQSEI